MKPVKFGLRVWLAIVSVFSFLGGWVVFSHAGKPAPLFPPESTTVPEAVQGDVTTVPMPTLEPIPSLDSLTSGSNLQALPSVTINNSPSRSLNNNSGGFVPRMRTRGS